MPRNRNKPKPRPVVPADRQLLELDAAAWAGERIARGGRRDALLGRVETLRLSLDGRLIEARVRGNRPLPYRVTVEARDGSTVAVCTCSSQSPGPCRHAVAALEALRFPATTGRSGGRRRGRTAGGRGRIVQPAALAPGFVIIGDAERTRTRDERVAAAIEEERDARRQRARRERAALTAIDDGSGLPRWQVAPRTGQAPQLVTLRGSDEERFGCTCDDFAENELQSCSHVERVKNERSRQRKDKRRAVAVDVLSVWCCPREWVDRAPVPMKEIRIDRAEARDGDALERYFDREGWLREADSAATSPSMWLLEACKASRRDARDHGLRWELDAEVRRRIRAARQGERRARRQAAAAEDTLAWRDVIGRVQLRLHEYQEQGARFLARTGRALLADDMGLGKTVQAVVAALLLRERAALRRVLVVCPASLKHQWRQEIVKICGERATIVDGSRETRLRQYAEWSEGFLIVNYELVLRDLETIRAAGAGLVILDEAQRIKNWSTKTAIAVKQLDSPHAFVLTGTPLENRLLELHSLVEFLHRRAAGPRWRVLPFHAVTEPGGRVIAYEGLDVLRGRMRDFFLRRERSAVLDQLPERTDNTFWTDMSEEQMRPYGKHAAAAAAVLSKRPPLGADDVRTMLRALTAMRILCNSYAQYDWQRHEPLLGERNPADLRLLLSPKLEEFARVMEDLLDESDCKVVVFSQWERMLRLAHVAVRELLEQRDLHAEVFYGGLTGAARAEMLDAFRADPGFRVLFSTDAGGLGLNLQDAASVVVNLEVPWNPAVLEQRIGRVHRIGQRRSVQVLHFVTRGAIEERVRSVVEAKRALFDGLLVDEVDRVVFDGPAGASWLERARALLDDADTTNGAAEATPAPGRSREARAGGTRGGPGNDRR